MFMAAGHGVGILPLSAKAGKTALMRLSFQTAAVKDLLSRAAPMPRTIIPDRSRR
jgi:hypothetical protein